MRHAPEDVRRLLSSAFNVLDQTPPPSLREILSAYRTKGDGDRDMLLAMLNAKTAEDQRLASMASLQRTMLDIYQQSPPSPEPAPYSRPIANGAYNYPTPQFNQSPRLCDQPPSRRAHHRHRAASRSRSPPPRGHVNMLHRDVPIPHHSEQHPRKRHRPTHSPHVPHAAVYETSHPSEQFPPSPYSSSGRSDSAEYSPRSRASMTIGNLLSTGPSREMHGDTPSERD
ncbi:unnamed protein product [Cyclocybe aegerita]|uniref:Uncharacterized protein n=1 Tax=Cyclocybe aegerita TaxID=1973307 RepID=A0A8S0XJW6_CYCAE|nr:unnamed protein product [Cyclocybe aegerita]